MPNRVLRDWTISKKIEMLDSNAERFFTRLIMKVDDFGCFYADPRLLKANLFPLLMDKIREADISRWMAECQKAGLIVLYVSAEKQYLQILDFKQTLRQKKPKYPAPEDATQTLSTCLAIAKPETETKQKQETETKVKVRENVLLASAELLKLEMEFKPNELNWMLDKLSAYKLSSDKTYKSDYGAIRSWVIDEFRKHQGKTETPVTTKFNMGKKV
jgi:hypothetical protein